MFVALKQPQSSDFDSYLVLNHLLFDHSHNFPRSSKRALHTLIKNKIKKFVFNYLPKNCSFDLPKISHISTVIGYKCMCFHDVFLPHCSNITTHMIACPIIDNLNRK